MFERKEIEFSLDDFIEMHPIPSLNLPDIQEEKCYIPKDGAAYLLFVCSEASRYKGTCPVCGSAENHVHGSLKEPRLIHDVSVGTVQVDILLNSKRYRCKKCGATFVRPFSSVIDNKQMTKRLLDQIRRESFRRTFAEVADDYGYSATLIAQIFDEYAEELETSRGPVVAPKILGIDEKHICHAMRGVFVDVETGVLLEMTENNKADDIISTIESMVDYDKNIQYVTMDMANGYRSFVEECLPNAKIVVDRFHVIHDLWRKTSSAKSSVYRYVCNKVAHDPDSSQKEQRKELLALAGKDPWVFRYSAKAVAENKDRLALMADLCLNFPEFNHLRLLKEGLERIYDSADRFEAKQKCDEWRELVPPSGDAQIAEWEQQYGVKAELYKEYRSLKRTLNRWEEYILNYFDSEIPYTNAVSEGINSMVERINIVGSGYGFRRLRAKCIFYNTAARRVRYSAKAIKKDLSKRFGYITGPVSPFPSVVESMSIVEAWEPWGIKPLSALDWEDHPLLRDK